MKSTSEPLVIDKLEKALRKDAAVKKAAQQKAAQEKAAQQKAAQEKKKAVQPAESEAKPAQ